MYQYDQLAPTSFKKVSSSAAAVVSVGAREESKTVHHHPAQQLGVEAEQVAGGGPAAVRRRFIGSSIAPSPSVSVVSVPASIHSFSDGGVVVGASLHCILLVYYYLCVLPLTFVVLFNDLLSRFVVFVGSSIGSRLQSLCISLYYLWMVRMYLPEHTIKDLHFGPSFSFSGGGMLWTYYLGVAHHLFVNYDVRTLKILASSAGVFVAIPLVCGDDPYDWCRRDWGKCIAHFEGRPILGTFFDDPLFYRNLWDNYLPADAHVKVSGRLFLSITLFPSFRNVVVSQYDSREELLDCILATMCLPIVFLRTFIKTGKYGLAIDGGITNDLPCVDRYTVTCSAINTYADIHPLEAFTPLDLIRVPSMDEVFDISEGACREAEKCRAFEQHHWKALRRVREGGTDDGEGTAATTTTTTTTTTTRGRRNTTTRTNNMT